MEERLGEHLFTFAAISDTHVNEGDDVSASPFASNRRANARFRYVVQELNRLRPAFTVHLGDMGNPLPQLGTYGRAAAAFREIAGGLDAPLHLVPGNHCVGDKPTGWVPVPRVGETALELYREHYGRPFYAFDHGPGGKTCRFLVLNSLLFDSGLGPEREQEEWLEEELETASRAARRLFVLMHYPAFVASPYEPGGYDNLDEPGRSRLLALVARHAPEAAFSGHVHNYFYNRYAATHLYTLPATSFVRQDYSELFTARPGDGEGGRDDRSKLGYCLVKVYARGHVVHLVRTHGRTLEAGEPFVRTRCVERVHAREGKPAPVGIEMRENWLAATVLRTNNSISPFVRRAARNDWAVAALEGCGIQRVRVSLRELDALEVRRRMAALAAIGYRFTVYSYGIPGDEEFGLVRAARGSLATWEIVLDRDAIDRLAAGRLRLPAIGGPEVPGPERTLSEMRDPGAGDIDDANVKHVANYGFQAAERQRVERLCAARRIREAFRGLVFRVRRREEERLTPRRAIREIGEMGRASGMRHQAHILFSGNLTADRMTDDASTANRVAEAAFAAAAAGNVEVFFDTFEDVDRGYFVRHGLVDRLYNPRPAGEVLAHLNAALAPYELPPAARLETRDLEGGRLLALSFPGVSLGLALPRPSCELRELPAPEADGADSLSVVDLLSGTFSVTPAERSGERIVAAAPVAVDRPMLFVVAGGGPSDR